MIGAVLDRGWGSEACRHPSWGKCEPRGDERGGILSGTQGGDRIAASPTMPGKMRVEAWAQRRLMAIVAWCGPGIGSLARDSLW